MSEITYTDTTDTELLASLGNRLRALRKARGLTQQEAADRAGLARSTVHEAERGDNATLLTLIRLLRVYGRLAALEDFIPEPEVSPMQRLRAAKRQAERKRQRREQEQEKKPEPEQEQEREKSKRQAGTERERG